MPSSVLVSGAVLYDHALMLSDPRVERPLRCTCKDTRFHSKKNLWNMEFPMTSQVVERQFLLETDTKNKIFRRCICEKRQRSLQWKPSLR